MQFFLAHFDNVLERETDMKSKIIKITGATALLLASAGAFAANFSCCGGDLACCIQNALACCF
jgi:hypothetical protein